MERNSFIFYKSFYEASQFLSDEEKGKLFDMICQYGLYGNEINGDGLSQGMFLLIKPQLDANNKRYLNGCKGGAPEGNNNAKKKSTKNQPKINQKQPNDNYNVNDNYNKNNKIDSSKEESNIYSPKNEICVKNEEFAEIEHPQAPVEGLGFYDFDDPYVQSMMKNKNFWNNNWKSLQKLMKKGYTIETIKTVCAFIRQDSFWCKNIRSLSKLLEKNKDGVMYIDVMIDKIKQWKPKVIDLDSLY